MQECHRVLKDGGIIRVVVPDLEQIVRWYLKLLDESLGGNQDAQKRYDWIMLELFDQMVRNVSGGDMLKYWKNNPIPAESFVIERCGSEVLNPTTIIVYVMYLLTFFFCEKYRLCGFAIGFL
jgi:DNA modification methylase